MSTNEHDSCLMAAITYLRLGWPVFPIGKNDDGSWKKPLVSWKEYQTSLPSEEQVQAWWETHPDARVAIVTGKISGLVVVDIDADEHGVTHIEGIDLPKTLIAKTGGGGFHYVYRMAKDQLYGNKTGVKPGIDIRAEGGYIVAPPSIHASGKAYEWDEGFNPALIAACPDWVNELFMEGGNVKGTNPSDKKWSSIVSGVPEGRRNDAATKFVGSILSRLKNEDFEAVGWGQLVAWNSRNTPPLAEKELRSVFESIKARELDQRNRGGGVQGQDDRKEEEDRSYFKLFLQAYDISFCRDAKRDGYVRIKSGAAYKLISSGSAETIDLYRTFFFEKTGKPPTDNKVREVMSQLSAHARLKGELISPSLRVAKKDDTYYYDLANEACECVRIDTEGWRIVTNPGIPLIANRLTTEQRRPESGGDVKDIFRFINVKSEDDRLLLIATLTACFIPDIPHPVLILHGPKGSAKSTATRLIKTLVDPSEVTSSQLTGNMKDIALSFYSSWLIPFDNVTYISSEVSDVLSKVVTGDSFATRKLYTDGELHVMSFRRCLIINGINNPVKKPDLLDRAVLIEIERIDDSNRKAEAELQGELTSLLPKVLGSLFDLTSKALATFPTVPRSDLARLADFDLWGRAVSIALMGSAEPFMQAYGKNINRQSDEAIEQSRFAQILIEYLQSYVLERVEITPTALLKAISDYTDEDTRKAKDFPKAPAKLSQRLTELSPDLLTFGFRITRRMTGRERLIVIEPTTKNSQDASPVAQGDLLETRVSPVDTVGDYQGTGSWSSEENETDAADGTDDTDDTELLS